MKVAAGRYLTGRGSPLLTILVGVPLAALCGFLSANSGSAFLGFGLLFSFVLPVIASLMTRRFLLLLAPLVNMTMVHSFLYFSTREKDAFYLTSETGKNLFVFFGSGSAAIALAIACAYLIVSPAKSTEP